MAKKFLIDASALKKAEEAEKEADILKRASLKTGNARPAPERVAREYEKAADLYRQGGNLVKAEDLYRSANRYGFVPYNPRDAQRVNDKIKSMRDERTWDLVGSGRALEQRAYLYLAIIGFASSFLSITLKLTGNVVGTAYNKSNWISLCLFAVGCLFTVFYFRARRKKVY